MKNNYQEKKQQAVELFKLGFNTIEIANRIQIHRKTIGRWLRSEGCVYSKHNKCNLTSNIFSVIDTEEKAYWLGFIYADGCIMKNGKFEISLKKDDNNHLEKFKKFISYEGKVSFKTSFSNSKSYESCRISFKDIEFCKDLINLGAVIRKSLVLTFPSKDQVPEILISHFIRGYFDGDGHITDPEKRPLTIDIIGTESILIGILKFYDISQNLFHDKKHDIRVLRFALCGSKARKIVNSLYDNNSICLDRKKQRFNEHVARYNRNVVDKKRRKSVNGEIPNTEVNSQITKG